MTKFPTNPAGAPVLTCDLDEKCVEVDCKSFLPEFPPSLADNPEATDYVDHFCGLDYLARQRQHKEEAEEG